MSFWPRAMLNTFCPFGQRKAPQYSPAFAPPKLVSETDVLNKQLKLYIAQLQNKV